MDDFRELYIYHVGYAGHISYRLLQRTNNPKTLKILPK